MNSHGCKGKKSITPSFFKIILQTTLEEQKLLIPVKFVKNHGENLQNQATLKVPDDSTWKIDLEKCNGTVWMERGWKEFSDYYSLAYGHFLVFKYRGNSDFSVFIFDHTATEIDYPLSNRRNADHELPEDVEDSASDSEDESIEILESCSLSRMKRERFPLPSPNPRNTKKTDPTSKASGEKGSSSSGVPFFEADIPCSCIKPYVLSVPMNFTKKYMKREKQEMQLQVGDSLWPVTLLYYPRRSYCTFSAGWMAFARGNSLDVGDKCTFELIKRNVLRVSISRKQRHLN